MDSIPVIPISYKTLLESPTVNLYHMNHCTSVELNQLIDVSSINRPLKASRKMCRFQKGNPRILWAFDDDGTYY